jgi:hypothetical protein
MRIPFSQATPAHLRDADVIVARGPARRGFSEQVWSVPAICRPWPSSPHLLRIVEVMIDSRDEEQLGRLRQMVREAKSCQVCSV